MNTLLSILASLISPVARLLAQGAIALVKKTETPADNDFLRELAKNIIADLPEEPKI